MPVDPTPAPPLPPKYIMDFMGIDEDDWTKWPAYYEAHYHEMAPELVKFAQAVRDAALREAAMVSVPFAGVVHSISNPCDACQFAYTNGALDAASAFHRAILALVGTAPKEA